MIVCGAGYYGCPKGEDHHYHCRNCGAISGIQGHALRDPGTAEVAYECPPAENQQRYVHMSRLSTPVQLTAEEEDGPYED